MISYTEENCMNILEFLDGKLENKEIIKRVIHNYFHMIQHMKETSLYDVYMYENNITKGITVPMKILTNENNELKKEVNQLRKKLQMGEKYNENCI